MTGPELWFDQLSKTWTLRSAESIEAVLADPTLRVRQPNEPIPSFLLGTRAGQIFGNLARMTDGEAHTVRRSVVEAIIGLFNLDAVARHARTASARLLMESDDLNGWIVNVSPVTLGTIFGVESMQLPALALSAGAFARAISPGATPVEVESGIIAANDLWARLSNLAVPDRVSSELWISNVIGLFFQGNDSMAGLLGNSLLYKQAHPDISDVRTVIRHVLHVTPPIRNTRRFAAEDTVAGKAAIVAGSSLLIDLEAAMHASGSAPSLAFGSGPHACPGQMVAFTIAAAALEAGPRLDELPPNGIDYFPYPNARVPDFRGVAIPGGTT